MREEIGCSKMASMLNSVHTTVSASNLHSAQISNVGLIKNAQLGGSLDARKNHYLIWFSVVNKRIYVNFMTLMSVGNIIIASRGNLKILGCS